MYKDCIIYHSPDLELSSYVPLFNQCGISLNEIVPSNIQVIRSHKQMKIILLSYEFLDSLSKEKAEGILSSSHSSIIILIKEDHDKSESCRYLEDERVFLYIKTPVRENELLKAVRSGVLYLRLKSKCESLQSEISIRTAELNDINRIGMTAAAEQDLDKLLFLILSKSRLITNCDAGSLYLLEETGDGERRLIFKLTQNDSLTDLSFHEYTLPLNRESIAGYVAVTGKFVNIADAYNIPDEAEYKFNRDFDKRFNYRTKSMLVIPMKDYKGKTIGVLQLINRKRSLNVKLTSEGVVDAEVISFDEKAIELINSISSQTFMPVGNNVWSQTVQKIFELSDLNKIGIALSTEQDYDKLLSLILTKCREITNCDAGSLYILEETKEGERALVFKLIQNDSLADLSFHEYKLPLNRKSITGYAAITGELVNLADVYNIPDGAEYAFNRDFDKKFNYQTRSMLVIPMNDHKGKTIGVVQLINRKKSRNTKLASREIVGAEVIPFDKESIEMLKSLTSQAAVSIENNLLYQSIHDLFEGFVKASVHAIEQRDPTTSGHSERVTIMTVELARLVDKTTEGRFKDVHFTDEQLKELQYAALLHDFGKVGVREHILVKAKKLYPHDLELIMSRFDLIKRTTECKYLKKKIDLLCNKDTDDYRIQISRIDRELEDALKELDNYLNSILKANEPAILEEGTSEKLMQIAGKTYPDCNEKSRHYLTPHEIGYLSIKKGTLNEDERCEIESHSAKSYEFLKKIPWTKELEQIPDIAHTHHETLNGAGYPLKLNDEQISIQSKIMAIVDIYDALTASDRPYKKAVSRERALDIIGYEVKGNRLDADLFDLFVKGKVYELV